MALVILALLIGVPLAEIALFIEVGGWIGLWPTIGTVVLTAILGTALLRQQGLATLQRAQAEMNAQRLPMRELFDGACLLVAGVLLLTPGFLTDAVGFALLVPPLRSVIGMAVWRAMQKRGTVHVRTTGFTSGPPPGDGESRGRRRGGRGPVIEGEYEDLSEPDRETDDDAVEDRRGEDAASANPESPWRRGTSRRGL